MFAPTTVLPLPDVSPDVLAFAKEQGVAAYLPAVLGMTRRIFPTYPLRIFTEDDPEIANDRHIVLEVQVPDDAEVETLLDLRGQWVREIFEQCPSTHVCVFRLGMV
ncbi:MAG TPA: hypothetical protein VH643_18340 [Gemmataceae bacterium]